MRGALYRAAPARAADAGLGALAALGLAPWGLWPLSLLALGAIIWRFGARATSARTGFAIALAAGTGFFAVALFWIIHPFLVEPERYGWMAPFALVLMALGGGLFWAVPGAVAGALTRRGGSQPRAAAFAAALLLSDWLRGWIFTGFPWAQLGQIWVDTPVAQSAAQIGAIGLSALTLAAAALPSILARSGRPRGALGGAMFGAMLVLSLWFSGSARLGAPTEPDRDIILRLVQPNADQALKWDPEWALIFWERLLIESAAPPAPGARRPDAVIWPETAVSFLLNHGGEALPAIGAAAGAPVILGIQREEAGEYYNSLIEIDESGAVGLIYDKFHLVPFGEYLPFGAQLARLGIGAFAARASFGYARGRGPQVMSLAGLPPAQPLICYEAIFPQHLRGQERPEWLLQITNDAWFGTYSGPYQHLAQARLRAIETGLPLLRAANTGVSAVIDPYGRVTARLGLGETGHIDAALPAPLPPTLWLRAGPAPTLTLALFVLAGAFWRARRRG
ncbi:MAG: apolipoprotein N-acyltransferase [Paracoccus sp. (in: a-proteobacteria)]|nr:apolipoprotein N-acyltransferase [Paracoccus sp. (in: a-proteobacteria)]